MKGQWLTDYLGHMQVAASDACSFVEGLNQSDFNDDKRTQSAVVIRIPELIKSAEQTSYLKR